MALDVVVTAREVDTLICPYTGEKLEVHMVVQPGSVTYSAPKAFTLHEPVATMEELLLRASMRNGVTGSVPGKGPVICAYTGEPLRLRTLPDGRVCFTGGFNPRAMSESLGEFVYKASMRNGETEMKSPTEFRIHKSSKHRYLRKKEITPSADTMATAEKITEQTGLYKKSVRGASLGKRK